MLRLCVCLVFLRLPSVNRRVHVPVSKRTPESIVLTTNWNIYEFLLPPIHLLKTESCHNANFVVTGGTASRHYDNSRFPVIESWRRHQMETFSALLAFCSGNSPVTGEFPAQRPVTRNFDVFFDLHLNQQLSKQWRRRWIETPSRSLWRHCNDGSFVYKVALFKMAYKISGNPPSP